MSEIRHEENRRKNQLIVRSVPDAEAETVTLTNVYLRNFPVTLVESWDTGVPNVNRLKRI